MKEDVIKAPKGGENKELGKCLFQNCRERESQTAEQKRRRVRIEKVPAPKFDRICKHFFSF
jgi:hypothetical protein